MSWDAGVKVRKGYLFSSWWLRAKQPCVGRLAEDVEDVGPPEDKVLMFL